MDDIMASALKLTVCVLLIDAPDLDRFEWKEGGEQGVVQQISGGDPRVVVVSEIDFFEDWEAKWRGKEDIWDLAERKIARQRKLCGNILTSATSSSFD